MHILLTNDDGIFAPGLAALYKECSKLGRVTVAAPADMRSAASHSISLQPVVCDKLNIMGVFEGYSVDGTPGDCVKLALNELIDTKKDPVDLVLSGINFGANVGVHVFYSGTVAAAMEAAFHGVPAIAVSAAYEEKIDFETSVRHAGEVIRRLLPLENGNVVNINTPKVSLGEPKGVKVVPHAASGFREGYAARIGEDGQIAYHFTSGNPKLVELANGTDTAWLDQGYITVTALRLNLNDPRRNRQLQETLEGKAVGSGSGGNSKRHT